METVPADLIAKEIEKARAIVLNTLYRKLKRYRLREKDWEYIRARVLSAFGDSGLMGSVSRNATTHKGSVYGTSEIDRRNE